MVVVPHVGWRNPLHFPYGKKKAATASYPPKKFTLEKKRESDEVNSTSLMVFESPPGFLDIDGAFKKSLPVSGTTGLVLQTDPTQTATGGVKWAAIPSSVANITSPDGSITVGGADPNITLEVTPPVVQTITAADSSIIVGGTASAVTLRAVQPPKAASQFLKFGIDPAGTTNSTTGVAMGLAQGAQITPLSSGNIFVNISFDGTNNTSGQTFQAFIIYNQSVNVPPPHNGDVPAATQLTAIAGPTSLSAANFLFPMSLTGLIQGAAVGVQYWIDILLKSSGGGSQAAIKNVSVLLYEL